MKVWIDLANSPHPLLFAPIAEDLVRAGHEPLVTARDNAQTVELAREHWPGVEVLGGPSPPGRARKAGALAARVESLRRWARRRRPNVALSHNSYAQIVAARAARVPVVTAMDYEHQPSNHLAFRLARTVIVPECFPDSELRRQGGGAKAFRYPGLKESIYLGEFTFNTGMRAELGLAGSDSRGLVVARTPPTGAIYHRDDNPLFGRLLDELASRSDLSTVVLARGADQREELIARDLPNVVVPGRALDSRSLVRGADLMLGAGGTMTREAALMGVPTLSVFAGRVPAVDRVLEQRGELRRISSVVELGRIERGGREPVPIEELRRRGADLRTVFASAVEEAV